ncbi:MAG: chitobiase/beta-hexosaminidase C-terminal domain-containing protein [Methanobacterium sp.]|nr:chitobiase/beta-hexosaminidase C-terminal domain-containing protein [Methanobacterium sp.]
MSSSTTLQLAIRTAGIGISDQQGNYQTIYVPNSYYFAKGGGGLNPVQLSTDPTNKVGQLTTTTNQSGTFWIVFSGGIGHLDNAILMLAVNGTIPDDFALHITSSGYTYTLAAPALSNPATSTLTNVTWVEGAVNETFYKSDFIYGLQSWKPANSVGYSIFKGQDPSNNFSLMFIDLYASGFCTNAYPGVTNGSIRVDYSFENLESFAAFNAYGWFSACNWGTGIPMTSNIAQSAFNVIGVPATSFTANTTTGNNSLNVQFTDTSSNGPTSWSWDFNGDGVEDSTQQNPTYTYNTPGTYTVSLTASNLSGNNTLTKTDYITVLDTIVPTVAANVTSGNFSTAVNVTLTASEPGTIYYTTDGTDPTTSSKQYTGSILIANTTTLKFMAVDNAGNKSPVETETYNIKSDVYVEVTPSISSPVVGDTVRYTFKLGNRGPGSASNVVFTYQIPEGMEFAGVDKDVGNVTYDPATRTITWTIDEVPVGDPYLWLDLKVLTAGNYLIQPIVTTSGYNPGLISSIGSLGVNAVTASTGSIVNAASTTTVQAGTVPMQSTGAPLAGLILGILCVGSGLIMNRKK